LRTFLPALAILVAWLATPFGLPTLLAAWIAQSIFQAGSAGDRVEKKMREEIGRAMATELRLAAPKEAQKVARAFAAESMEPIRKEITQGMASRIEELTRSVDSTREVLDQGEEAVERRRGELARLDELLNRAGDEIGDVVAELTRM
jgi:hypothetical protein